MKQISIQELKNILNDKNRGNIVVIDVRTADEHRMARIPQVINMPLDEIERNIAKLRSYDTVFVHCQSGNRSQRACLSLTSLGLENVVNVTGGMNEWERLGLEVVRDKDNRMPIMQQVLLTAGVLILSGFLAASFAHPYFLALPLLVGVGLTYAGASGQCLMAMILAKMPWNR